MQSYWHACGASSPLGSVNVSRLHHQVTELRAVRVRPSVSIRLILCYSNDACKGFFFFPQPLYRLAKPHQPMPPWKPPASSFFFFFFLLGSLNARLHPSRIRLVKGLINLAIGTCMIHFPPPPRAFPTSTHIPRFPTRGHFHAHRHSPKPSPIHLTWPRSSSCTPRIRPSGSSLPRRRCP